MTLNITKYNAKRLHRFYQGSTKNFPKFSKIILGMKSCIFIQTVSCDKFFGRTHARVSVRGHVRIRLIGYDVKTNMTLQKYNVLFNGNASIT